MDVDRWEKRSIWSSFHQPGLIGGMHLTVLDRDALQTGQRLGEHVVVDARLLESDEQQPRVGLVDALLPSVGETPVLDHGLDLFAAIFGPEQVGLAAVGIDYRPDAVDVDGPRCVTRGPPLVEALERGLEGLKVGGCTVHAQRSRDPHEATE
jgi:hypothetical protein